MKKLRCGVPYCNEPVNPLGYCNTHPLYCWCAEPDIDSWGMCVSCYRKPPAAPPLAAGGIMRGCELLIREGDCFLPLLKSGPAS